MNQIRVYQYPTEEQFPNTDLIKKKAQRVGRTLGEPAKYEKAVDALRKVLNEQDSAHLRYWAQCLMLDPRWCGATGQGGYWAHATVMVNRLSQEIIQERGNEFRAKYGGDFVVVE